MKFIKSLLVLSALAFSTTALAESKQSQCISTVSNQKHIATMEATQIRIQGTLFTFAESRTLKNGRDLFLFLNEKNDEVLGLTLDANQNMLYLISDMDENTLDEGVCKS